MERSGWWVFSSTMEEVPEGCWLDALFFAQRRMYSIEFTQFDHDGELTWLLAHVDRHCCGR